MTEPSKQRLPWHLKLVTGYLVVAGFWGWIGLWSALMGDPSFLRQFLVPIVFGFGISAFTFGAAYLFFKRNKLGGIFIVLAAICRWGAFATMYPEEVGGVGYAIDIDFFRQMPLLVRATLGFDLVLALYGLFAWKARVLR